MNGTEQPAGEDNVLRPQWRQQPPGPPTGPWPLVRAAIPLVLILGALGWVLWDRERAAAPRVEFSDTLPESAEAGMMDLARGDCQTASAHFKTAARRNPDQPRIRVLQGASHLCAGDAAEALDVLQPLADLPTAPPQMWWYLAQACLIQGDTDCALEALEQAMEKDPRHREGARRQQRQLMVLLSQD